MSLIRAAIEVRESTVQGYGVFATQTIAEGEIIEECPVIFVDSANTNLENYWFLWDKDNPSQKLALALGYGTLYNHAQDPNAEYKPDYSRRCLTFKALKRIAAGEEIFVYYAKEWFNYRGIQEQKPPPKYQDLLILGGKILLVAAAILLLRAVL